MHNNKNNFPLKTVTHRERYRCLLEHNKTYHSSIDKLSSCIKVSNLDKIIQNVIKDSKQQEICQKLLQKYLVDNDYFDFDLFTRFDNVMRKYNNNYAFSNNECLKRFTDDYETNDISQYFNAHYSIGERSKTKDKDITTTETAKSLYIDFDVDVFNTLYNFHENWYYYEITYRHLFILSLMLKVMADIIRFNNKKEEEKFYSRLCRCVKSYAGLSIISGMVFHTEFDIGSPYGELYEELVQLTPLQKDEMIFKYTPEKRSFDITIKDSRFLSDAYAAWWNNAWTEKDIGKKIKITTQEKPYVVKKQDVMLFDSDEFTDSQDISKVRIIQGQNYKTINVTATCTGMRIIARIIDASGNAAKKVFTDKLSESFMIPDDMTACLLWRILWRTEQYQNGFKTMRKSYHNTYLKFIDNTQINNDKAAKSAVIIILSQMSKEQREEFIKLHPLNERTKIQIKDGSNKLNKMKQYSKGTKAELIKFLGGLKQYVW